MNTETMDVSSADSIIGHSCEMGDKYGEQEQPIHEGRKLVVLLRTSQCLQFKSLFECMKELLDEVNVEFVEGKGVRLVTLDPGKVAMVHLVINAVEYFFAKGTVTAGLNMTFFYKIVRSLTSGDLMIWRIYEDSPTDFHVEIINSERKTRTVSVLKLLDLDEVEISVPGIQFDRVVSMPSSDLTKYIREMSSISNIITIRGTRKTLEFQAKGEMASSKITVSPTASGLNWKHSQDVDEIEGTFYVKYLEKFCKCNVETNVELYLKDKLPLILLYQLSIGTLRFCLAQVETKNI